MDANGVPLSLIVTGANAHDSKAFGDLLDARVVNPAKPETVQNLCLDAGYVGKEEVVKARGYIPHIRPRGEEADKIKRDPNAGELSSQQICPSCIWCFKY